MKKLVVASLLLVGIFSVNSCARQGTPSGGPKDVTPPKLLGSFPDTLAVNVDPNIKEIEINFDEYVQLKEYNKNVVVSPPFERNPTVTPISMAEKSVKIKLREPLQPNTTYSFNFGDAIQDFNENNKLSNFTYVFSTGNFIDSLNVKGRVFPGAEFELPKKVLVGLFTVDDNYNDSVILKSKPYYISRVNEKGEYDLKFLKSGKYKLVAFEDKVENTKFDFGKERIAFNSDIIDLTSNKEVNLKLFDQKPNYRVADSKQKGYGHIVIKTEGATQPVKITPSNKELTTALYDIHPKQDSVNIWFNPAKENFTNKSERLKFEVQHGEKVDSVSVLYTTPTKEYKSEFKPLNDSKLAPTQDFKIAALAPIKSINKSLINVFKDTVQIPFDAVVDSIDKQIVRFKFDKNLGENFEVNVYPKGIIDHFDVPNDTLIYQMKTGKREDYGNLKVNIQNLQDSPIFLQLIKKNQKFDVIEEKVGLGREFLFPNLNPGDYYLRLFVDENKNGVWDTGDILSGKQPEPVYIYPSKIVVRAMWDSDETWIIGKESEQFILPKEGILNTEQQPNNRQ
ncbi:Ig-like domain-containing protein [Faecalibacter bovis]|uniref:Ig-like domain-containing protein n=1 Tax=Faecalibacter bovis TaxID=2898187 RepID=A0ABX7XFQ9_9FLAO|nr:Ig-like domain-containing protein [Faecalibacter bovis]QTV06698.1 Ig-like domain-containing protein [Faecalibacter bovis]